MKQRYEKHKEGSNLGLIPSEGSSVDHRLARLLRGRQLPIQFFPHKVEVQWNVRLLKQRKSVSSNAIPLVLSQVETDGKMKPLSTLICELCN